MRAHLTVPTCSRVCLEIWEGRRAVIDASAVELRAMAAAGERGGEFIEALHKTDMAAWSEKEWCGFIGTICGGYVDALIRAQIDATEALSRVRVA